MPRFSKMHGAGNDFVVIDRRAAMEPFDPALARRLGHRHTGIGFDQLMSIETPRTQGAVASYSILNPDGSRARQCGNGARAVAAWLVREGSASANGEFMLDSPAGSVRAWALPDGRFRIDMGEPDFSPAAIGPAAIELDVDAGDPHAHELVLDDGSRMSIGIVSMGNLHAVIEVDDADTADVARIGPALQRHPAFRNGCNVGFAQVLDATRLRLRVHESGAGETLACGSGACAAVAVFRRRGMLGENVQVQLPGGTLELGWAGTGSTILMTGPARFVFEGEYSEGDFTQ